jgi:hypothetical protein
MDFQNGMPLQIFLIESQKIKSPSLTVAADAG